MSASANGQVIYGFGMDQQVLQVQDGTIWACWFHRHHEVIPEKSYCPCCGGRVEEIPKMVHSEVLCTYARKHALTGDAAFEKLSPYQWRAPNHRMWVFGTLICEGYSNTCTPFLPMGPQRVDIDMNELNEIFKEFGFNPEHAKYFLLVELS